MHVRKCACFRGIDGYLCLSVLFLSASGFNMTRKQCMYVCAYAYLSHICVCGLISCVFICVCMCVCGSIVCVCVLFFNVYDSFKFLQ